MKKIFKIITAIGNEEFNNKLKQENEFIILENDISYKEGVIEFLEENKDIDILIIYENLSGEIDIFELIKKIKAINSDINIFIILENKNEEFEKLLNKENIFYNNELNINEFIIKIKNSKINIEEELKKEIEKLNNIINKKNEEILNLKNNKFDLNEIKKNKVLVKKEGEKIEITIFKIKKYLINNKIQKNILKKINKI